MTRRTETVVLGGGLNTESPDSEIVPGQLVHAVNFEPGLKGGYRRIDGYERYDGRSLSSKISYYKVPCDKLLKSLVAGMTLLIGSATAVVTQAHSINDQYLYVASPENIIPNTSTILNHELITTTRAYGLLSQEKIIPSDSEASDEFGYDVAISNDGATLVSSAWREDGTGTDRGAAYVFTRTGSVWAQQQKLIVGDAGDMDVLGFSSSISGDGNTVVLTSYLRDEDFPNQGAAYVFVRAGTTWTQQHKLVASDGDTSDFFGRSSALSDDGDTVIVGTNFEDGGGIFRGAAYVFIRTLGVWTEQQKLVASDGGDFDYFGVSVSLSQDGSTAIVGALQEDSISPGGGAAYVFTRAAGVWAEQQKLIASDVENNDFFGGSVSLSGDGNTTIVGARQEDGAGTDRGATYVFIRTGTIWTQQQKLVASDGENTDYFGRDVALSNNGLVIVVGVPSKDYGSGVQGAAYLFNLIDGVWSEGQIVLSSDTAIGNSFGAAVDISSDGEFLAIGAAQGSTPAGGSVYIQRTSQMLSNYNTNLAHTTAWDVAQTLWRSLIQPVPGSGDIRGVAMREGEVIVFRDNAAGSEVVGYRATGVFSVKEQQVIFPDVVEAFNEFGVSNHISGDGDTLIVGAPSRDLGFVNAGATYVYIKEGGKFLLEGVLTASDAAVSDGFGSSVALSQDGNTAIVGAYLEGGAGAARGAAYVFTRTSGVWTEQQKLVASDAEDNDRLGGPISLSDDGNTAIVGAYLEDGVGTNRGAAYVFTRTSGVWTEQQKLLASDAENTDYFGFSVHLSQDGNTAIAGAYLEDAASPGGGAAYVFTRTLGVWTEQQKLIASDAGSNDFFGRSVQVSGDATTVIIGSFLEDGAGTNRGAAYVFTRTLGVWTEQQKLIASDGADSDLFGSSVAINATANIIVVTSPSKDAGGVNSGSAYVFLKEGGLWYEKSSFALTNTTDLDEFGESSIAISDAGTEVVVGVANLFDSGRGRSAVFQIRHGWEDITVQDYVSQSITLPTYLESGNAFGSEVTISGVGKYMAAGSPFDSEGAYKSGVVQLFERYGETWSESSKLNPPQELEGAEFGTSVSMSEDGAGVVVGAPGTDVLGVRYLQDVGLLASDAAASDEFGNAISLSNDGDTLIVGARREDQGGTDSGAAYVFIKSGGVWAEQQKLTASDAASTDLFGSSVAISADGNTVIVGAYQEDAAGTDRGAAYVFVRTGTVWAEQQKLTASDAANSDWFGFSTAMDASGDIVVIGAHQEDGVGSDRGAVYVFERAGTTWTQQQKLVARDMASGDIFGYSVAISSDGLSIVAGAISAEGTSGLDRGAVYVFIKTGSFWIEQTRLEASDGEDFSVYGCSVSLSQDGNILAVGAFGDDALLASSDRGAVYTYTRTDGTWSGEQKIIAATQDDFAKFGFSVKLSSDGSTLAIGAYESSASGIATGGLIHVYKKNTVWDAYSTLQHTSASSGDVLGQSIDVSANGDLVLGGAFSDTAASNAGEVIMFSQVRKSQGAVEYFERGVLGWGHVQTILSGTDLDGDKFGVSVIVSDDGSTLAVGAPYKSKNNLANVGYVQILEFDGVWTVRDELSLDSPSANDYFGYSLDISKEGKYLIIGQHGKSVSSNAGAGAVSIYIKLKGVWEVDQVIDAPNPEVSGNFGFASAISADGNIIAVGAPNENALSTDAGRAYVYENVSGTWTLKHTLFLEGSVADGNEKSFGYSLDLSEDGSVLIVKQGNSTEAGMLNIFHRNLDFWTLVWRETSLDVGTLDFAASVTMSPNADHIVCGSPATNANAGNVSGFDKAGGVLQPGGDYDFDNYNFIGDKTEKYLYGADGKNRGFEYTGARYRQIRTGMDVDNPTHVVAHQQHLFFSFGPSVQHSSLGDPHKWQVITGAAELGIGDNVTGFKEVRGKELAIFGRNETNVLYGSSTLDWELVNFSSETGAIAWTIQALGYPIFFDDRGVAVLPSVQAHGNFVRNTISEIVNSIILELRGISTASTIIRKKNQYRVFFTNGTGLVFTINAESEVAVTLIKYPIPVLKTVSAEGVGNLEEVYFGSTTGYIYRMDSGISFDGGEISSSFRLSRMDFGFPQYKKRLFSGEVYLHVEGYSEVDLTIDLEYEDVGNPSEEPQTFTFEDTVSFWSGEGLSLNKTSRERLDIKGVARTISATISSSSKLIYPHTVGTLAFDWGFRKKNN